MKIREEREACSCVPVCAQQNIKEKTLLMKILGKPNVYTHFKYINILFNI